MKERKHKEPKLDAKLEAKKTSMKFRKSLGLSFKTILTLIIKFKRKEYISRYNLLLKLNQRDRKKAY